MPAAVESCTATTTSTAVPHSPAPQPIAMTVVLVSAGENGNGNIGDSTFIDTADNGLRPQTAASASADGWMRHGMPDTSRSPSVGETFVSAADGHGSGSSSDSEYTEDDQEDVEMSFYLEQTHRDLGELNTPTTAANNNGQQNSKNENNSETLFDGVPSLPLEGCGRASVESACPCPSGSTSIAAISIDSAGDDDSIERELNEPPISVKIVPEKKGLFLKHSEYEIKMRTSETCVRRRYRDFVRLHGYLAEKYPYRSIPSLPPKQLIIGTHLEERRRGLQTWLTIMSQHPVVGISSIFVTFLQDKTPEFLYRLRVAYEKQIDEFSRLRSDMELSQEDREEFVASRDQLKKVFHSIEHLKRIFDDQTQRAEQQIPDLAEIDSILHNLGLGDVFPERTFDDMSTSAQMVARHTERYVRLQHQAVNERLHILLQILAAHGELCERLEKGIFAEYQRALPKALNLNRLKTMNLPTRGAIPDNSVINNPADRKEIAHCMDVELLGRRCAFGLSCVRSETEHVARYLQSLPSILLSYANEENQYHHKMSKIWHQLVISESSKLS